MWIPLEANPEVLNKYIKQLGVNSTLEFQDVWSLDPEMLMMIPKPVGALLLLFPITENFKKERRIKLDSIEKDSQYISPKLYYMKQTIGNACGTIGLIHTLANTLEYSDIGNGAFASLYQKSINASPSDRAKILEESKELAQIHETNSLAGQTEAPPAEDEVNLHFVAFVEKEGYLYEMDGDPGIPICHGKTLDFLADAARIIQERIANSEGKEYLMGDGTNFSVMAYAAPPE
ncbi:Ubiquitin carboxyl-terminal hydrolase isozyme L3 [Boothiomyces sp. JEL0838]|nr:Ubiquitin carboxyl-terminal hydrolase isozyme L3 [Boothiomyces sp. JEL0838]